MQSCRKKNGSCYNKLSSLVVPSRSRSHHHQLSRHGKPRLNANRVTLLSLRQYRSRRRGHLLNPHEHRALRSLQCDKPSLTTVARPSRKKSGQHQTSTPKLPEPHRPSDQLQTRKACPCQRTRSQLHALFATSPYLSTTRHPQAKTSA